MHWAEDAATVSRLTAGLPIGQRVARIFETPEDGMQFYVGRITHHSTTRSSSGKVVEVTFDVVYDDGDVEHLSRDEALGALRDFADGTYLRKIDPALLAETMEERAAIAAAVAAAAASAAAAPASTRRTSTLPAIGAVETPLLSAAAAVAVHARTPATVARASSAAEDRRGSRGGRSPPPQPASLSAPRPDASRSNGAWVKAPRVSSDNGNDGPGWRHAASNGPNGARNGAFWADDENDGDFGYTGYAGYDGRAGGGGGEWDWDEESPPQNDARSARTGAPLRSGSSGRKRGAAAAAAAAGPGSGGKSHSHKKRSVASPLHDAGDASAGEEMEEEASPPESVVVGGRTLRARKQRMSFAVRTPVRTPVTLELIRHL